MHSPIYTHMKRQPFPENKLLFAEVQWCTETFTLCGQQIRGQF